MMRVIQCITVTDDDEFKRLCLHADGVMAEALLREGVEKLFTGTDKNGSAADTLWVQR